MKNALVNYKQEVEICEKNAVTECFHFLENKIDVTVWNLSLSLILSVDVLAAIGIYFSSKFLKVVDNYRASLLRRSKQRKSTIVMLTGWSSMGLTNEI